MKSNKITKSIIYSFLAFSIFSCSTNTNVQSDNLNQVKAESTNSKFGKPVPGQYIIKFKENNRESINILNAEGVKSIEELGSNIKRVKFNTQNSNTAFNRLKNNPDIEYIEQDTYIYIPNPKTIKTEDSETPVSENSPNDKLFAQQFAHKVTESIKGWEVSKGSESVIIAIIDSGIDQNHPDLKGKLIPGFAVNNGNAYTDQIGHGTHVAGIAAAMTGNSIGIAGYAPNAKMMSVKIAGRSWASDVIEGINFAANSKADVFNMSFGVSKSKAVEDAINLALKKGKVLIAAMGNDSREKINYPAAFKGVIGVGATNSSDTLASFSTRGNHISVSAPGKNILSSLVRGKYGNKSGTSMASPAVAGLAALLKGKEPNLTNNQIRSRIEKGADDLGKPGFDKEFGHGRINVFNTLTNKPGKRQ